MAFVYACAGSLAWRYPTASVGSLLPLHQCIHVATCREGRGHPTGVGILGIAWVVMAGGFAVMMIWVFSVPDFPLFGLFLLAGIILTFC